MRQRILDLLMAGEHPATALADLVVAQMPLPDTAAAVFHVSDSQGVRCWRAPATSLSVRRNCAAVGSTLIHLRPREEDDSRTSLCESRSSKVDEWAASTCPGIVHSGTASARWWAGLMEELEQKLCPLTRSLRIWRMVESLSPPGGLAG